MELSDKINQLAHKMVVWSVVLSNPVLGSALQALNFITDGS